MVFSPSDNNQKLEDAEQRLEALNPNDSFIVRAPAGSGKTTILVQRYLKLLALVDSPNNIVAITFTKKAAQQMKARIVDWLKKAQQFQNKPNQEEFLASLNQFEKQSLELANKVIAKDKAKNWNLLLYSENLKVKTIDAFLQDLIRQLPFTSRKEAPTEKIKFYADLAVKNALNLTDESDEKIKTAYQNLIRHFSYNHQEIINALVHLLLKREQWLGLNYDASNQEKTIENIIKLELGKLNQLLSSIEPSAKEQLNYTYQFSKSYEDSKNFNAVLKIEKKLFNSNNPELLSEYQGAISRLVLTKDSSNYKFKKTVNKTVNIPNKLEAREEAKIGLLNSEAKEIRSNHIELLKQFVTDEKSITLLAQFKIVLLLPTVSASFDSINDLFILLKRANAELEVLFNHYKIVDFSAILLRVISALGEDDNPTPLSLHLDYQIQHLLIDEFQDVSRLQVRLIEKLIAGWDASSSGKSLFLVGDPMQSIYRFRKADVSNFNLIETNKRLSQLPITPLSLACNFRSSAELIKQNNKIFTELSEKNPKNNFFDSLHFEKAFAAKKQKNNSGVSVTTKCLFANKLHTKSAPLEKKQTERKIVELTISYIKNLLSSTEDNIAILFPTRGKTAKLVAEMNSEKIAFSSIGVDKLINQIEVLDLLSLTEILLNQGEKIAWYSLLRSTYCALSLDDLLQIKNETKRARAAENGVDQNSFIHYLAKVTHFLDTNESKSSLKKLIAHLSPLIHSSLSIYQKVEQFHRCFDFNFYSANQKENVLQFFALLRKINPSNYMELAAFKDSLAQSFINEPINERVQLMTIHAAKGLEFDHVICWNIAFVPQADRSYLLLDSVNLKPIIAINEKKDGSVFDWLAFLNKEKNKNEKNRLIYVALTRAKKSNLVVILNKSSDSLIKILIDQLPLQNINFPSEEKNKAKAIERIIEREKSLNSLNSANLGGAKDPIDLIDSIGSIGSIDLADSNNFSPIYKKVTGLTRSKEIMPITKQSSSKPIYLWAGTMARAIGVVAHFFIEKIATEGLQNWGDKKIDASEGWINFQLKKISGSDISKKECEKVRKILKNMISCQFGQFILKPHLAATNELKISYVANNQLKNIIIDRSFIAENNIRWIIDYKTSRHSGGNLELFFKEEKARYLKQLNHYAEIMQQLNPNQKIMLALYFPVHKKLISWRWN